MSLLHDLDKSLPTGLITESIIPECGGEASDDGISSETKWFVSILFGILFFVLSSPLAYAITDKAITSFGGISYLTSMDINISGLLVHSIIFMLVIRVILW